MSEISMTVLDVDEVKAGFLREDRRPNEILDQLFNLVIGENGGIVIHAEFRIENRMAIQDARFKSLSMGAGESTRMSQLQTNQQIIGLLKVLSLIHI